MNKKTRFLLPIGLLALAVLLTACTSLLSSSTSNTNTTPPVTNVTTNTNTNTNTLGGNTNSPVSNKEVLSGSVCNTFTSDYVTSLLGMTVIKTETRTDTGVNACVYYTNATVGQEKFIEIALENVNVANIKQGYVQVGSSTTTNPSIGMENFIGLRTDKTIRGIYLVMNPNKVVTISSEVGNSPVSDNTLIQIATQFAQRLQNYQ